VICFITALIHSHIRQPLPCLDRKEPTPLCLSAPPFITLCFLPSSPSQVLFPEKMAVSTWLWLQEMSLSQCFYDDCLTWQSEVTLVYLFDRYFRLLRDTLSNIFCENMWGWDYLSSMNDFFFFLLKQKYCTGSLDPLGHSCDTNERSTH